MNALFDVQMELSGGAAALDRQITLLLSTREGSVPLDRAFGLNLDFVDCPASVVKSLYTAEITKKIAQFLPAVRVQEVVWMASENGTLRPKVVITGA